MNRILLATAVLPLLVACGDTPTGSLGSSEDPRGYRVQSLVGALSTEQSYAFDVNDAGVVVGSMNGRPVRWVIDPGGGAPTAQALLTPEGDDPGPGEARSVSEAGWVVGFFGTDTIRPFVWDETGGLRALPLPDGLDAGVAYGVDAVGRIVGSGSTDVLVGDLTRERALLWTLDPVDGSVDVEDLGTFGGAGARAHAVNDAGDVVIAVQDGAGASRGVLRSPVAAPQDVPLSSDALGLNGRGEVAGASNGLAAIWTQGGVRTLASASSIARDLTDDGGTVVGEVSLTVGSGSGPDSRKGFGFVLTGEEVSYLEGLSGIDHSRARAVSASGIVVGESHIPDAGIVDAVFWIAR